MNEQNKKVPTVRFKGFTNDWEQHKLGEIITYYNGKSHEEQFRNAETQNFELVTLKSIDGNGNLCSSEKYIDSTNNTLSKNDLIMVLSEQNTGLVGMTTLIPRDNYYVLNQRVALLKLHKNNSPFFLTDAINQHQIFFERMSAGTKVQNISKSNVENFNLYIPNYSEQKEVGHIIALCQNIITLQQRKLALLKQLKKGLLQKMFADQDRKRPVLRFKGFSGDWEQRKLGDEYKHIGNAFVGTASPYYTQNGYFYLESNNIKNGQINHDHEVFINESFYHKQLNKLLHTGDLVMVQSGHVGDTAVITEKYNGTAAHALIMFRKPKNNMLSFFLNSFFQSSNAKNRIDVLAIGNTIRHILASDMKKFVVYLPDNKEKGEVAELFLELQKLIALQHQKLAKYQSVKKSLLQQMFI